MGVAVRKPSAERREEVVRAVLRIIGQQGLTSLTTTRIAEEVGVTSGALFRHFASLAEMVEGTFPDPALPPVERLLELARRRIRLLRAEPGLAWLLRSEQVYLTLPAEALEPLRGLAVRSRRVLLESLREGAARGLIRGDLDPELLLVPVMGTIHALIGMPGVHRTAAKGRPRTERVLAALLRMLAPPIPRTVDDTDRRESP
jgi:AcrR family transcriptional regulator